MSSMSCSAIRAIAGRSAVIRLAVNHLPTRRRQCWCSSPPSGMIGAISLLNNPYSLGRKPGRVGGVEPAGEARVGKHLLDVLVAGQQRRLVAAGQRHVGHRALAGAARPIPRAAPALSGRGRGTPACRTHSSASPTPGAPPFKPRDLFKSMTVPRRDAPCASGRAVEARAWPGQSRRASPRVRWFSRRRCRGSGRGRRAGDRRSATGGRGRACRPSPGRRARSPPAARHGRGRCRQGPCWSRAS